MILPALLIGLFVLNTRNKAEQFTGTKQFSFFTGWQLANNALYMYNHIQIDSTRLPSPSSMEINRLSKAFYSHVSPEFDDFLSSHGGNFFIQFSEGPLKKYLETHYHSRNEIESIRAWGQASIPFSEFGKWMILHHPMSYARYFMFMNTRNYFFPDLEKLQVYNLGTDEVNQVAQDWFDYKTSFVWERTNNIQGKILYIFPFICCFINLVFLGGLCWFIYQKIKRVHFETINSLFVVATVFFFLNLGFCISSTIIVLRYQFFPMLVTLSSGLLIIELLSINSQPLEVRSKEIPLKASPENLENISAY